LLGLFQQSLDPKTGWKIYNSAYCRIVSKGHTDTIFSFSAINCKPDSFFTTKTFARDPRNTVFLNCPKNSWYVDGIPPLGHNIPTTAEGLEILLKEIGIGYGRRIFWGGSMGGYGAVAMGALMHADYVIATGAELELLVAGGNSDLILRKIQGRSHIHAPNLPHWVANSKGRYFLYCGDFAYHDVISLQQVAHLPQVEYKTLEDFGHPLPAYIERTYGLIHFIDYHLQKHGSFPFRKGETGILWEYPSWWSLLHAAAAKRDESASSYLLHGVVDPSLPDKLRAHMAHALSLRAAASGDLDSSLEYAELGLQLAGPHSGFHRYRLACAMRDHAPGSDDWMETALLIHNLHDPDRWEFGDQLLRMLYHGFLDHRGEGQAEEFLRNQMVRSAKHSKRIDFLNSLRSIPILHKVWHASITQASLELGITCRLDKKELSTGTKLLVSGVFVSRDESHQIVVFGLDEDEGTICSQSSQLGSPGAATMLPDVPWAVHSRFRIEVQPSHSSRLRIRARAAVGLEWDFIDLVSHDQ
jgi:hypothetical protein